MGGGLAIGVEEAADWGKGSKIEAFGSACMGITRALQALPNAAISGSFG
jgi:hypothetical protein